MRPGVSRMHAKADDSNYPCPELQRGGLRVLSQIAKPSFQLKFMPSSTFWQPGNRWQRRIVWAVVNGISCFAALIITGTSTAHQSDSPSNVINCDQASKLALEQVARDENGGQTNRDGLERGVPPIESAYALCSREQGADHPDTLRMRRRSSFSNRWSSAASERWGRST